MAFCRVTSSAVVVGSTQRVEDVDLTRATDAGVAVVKRAAGGGAVLVGPSDQVWADFWLPRHDTLWDDDVVRSSTWVGETWTRALEMLGARGAVVNSAGSQAGDWSKLVCFAGRGPGEVTTERRKVVGMAQRRGRHGARFLTLSYLRWDPGALIGLLAIGPGQAAAARADLASVGAGLGEVLSWSDLGPSRIDSVEEAVTRCLP